MVCIYCGSETYVVNSRLKKRLNTVWRRRVCQACSSIFTTEESTDYSLAWAVTESDHQIKPFLRDKLFLSLYRSCGHRKSAIEDAAAITNTVTGFLINSHTGASISYEQIRQASIVALNRFDKVASAHYQAFHTK